MRAASRARLEVVHFSTIFLPSRGFFSSHSVSASDYGRLDLILDFVVEQLDLGLRLELRVRQLDADDRGQALAGVLAGEVGVGIFQQVLPLGPVVDGAGQRRAQPGQVRAAVGGVDGVGEGEHRLVVAVVVLDGGLDHVAFDFLLDVDRLVEHFAILVQVAHEAANAAFEVERHPACAVVGALITEFDGQAAVEERHLAEALFQRLKPEVGLLEDDRVGHEGGAGAGGAVGHDADCLQVGLRHAALVALEVHLAADADLHLQPFRQGVHGRDADAVEAARDLVRAAAELAAGVQLGHDGFQRRLAGLFVDVHRDAAAPVLHGDGAILVDRDGDAVAVTGHGLVDRVVHHFVDGVVQRLDVGAADVHAGATPHCLQSFEDLDIVSGIVIGTICLLSHCHYSVFTDDGPFTTVYFPLPTVGFFALSASRCRSSA